LRITFWKHLCVLAYVSRRETLEEWFALYI
jgi:hypothetical protein